MTTVSSKWHGFGNKASAYIYTKNYSYYFQSNYYTHIVQYTQVHRPYTYIHTYIYMHRHSHKPPAFQSIFPFTSRSTKWAFEVFLLQFCLHSSPLCTYYIFSLLVCLYMIILIIFGGSYSE